MSSEYCDPDWVHEATLARIDRAASDEDDRPLPICDDCGLPVRAFAKSFAFGHGISRVYGDRCYRLRVKEGWDLDPRSLRELQQREKSA